MKKTWWNSWHKQAVGEEQKQDVGLEQQKHTKESVQKLLDAGRGYDAAVALVNDPSIQEQFEPTYLFGPGRGQLKLADLFRVIKAEGVSAGEVLVPKLKNSIANENQLHVNILYDKYLDCGINYEKSPKFKVINDAITSMGFPTLTISDVAAKRDRWLERTVGNIKQAVKLALANTPNATDEEIAEMIFNQEGPYSSLKMGDDPVRILTFRESATEFDYDLREKIANLIFAEKHNPDSPNYAIVKTPEDVNKLRGKGVTDGKHNREFPYKVLKNQSLFYGSGANQIGRGDYRFSFALNSSDELELAKGRPTPFPEEIFRRLNAHGANGEKPVGFVTGTYTPREVLYVAEIQSDMLQRSSYIGRSYEDAVAAAKKIIEETEAKYQGQEMPENEKKKVKKLKWNIDIENSYGYYARKSNFMPEYDKSVRSGIENYFGGFTRMAMNTVLNFAKDQQIPVVYVASSDLLVEKWVRSYSMGERAELKEMFAREYDDMAQNIYGATREGIWWKIPMASVMDKIASMDMSFAKSSWRDRWFLKHADETGTPEPPETPEGAVAPTESEATEPEVVAPIPEAPKVPRRKVNLKMVNKMIDDGKVAEAIDAIISNKRIAHQIDWDEIFRNPEFRMRVWLDVITNLGLDAKQVFPPEARNHIIKDIKEKISYMFTNYKDRGQDFLKTEIYGRIKRMGELIGFDVDVYVKENLSSEIYDYPIWEHNRTQKDLSKLYGDEKAGIPAIRDSSHREFPYTIVPWNDQPAGTHGAEGSYDFSFAINSTDDIFPEEIFKTLNKHDAPGTKPVAFVFGKYTPGKILYLSEMQSDVIQRSQMYMQSYEDAVAKYNESTASLNAKLRGKDIPATVVNAIWKRETERSKKRLMSNFPNGDVPEKARAQEDVEKEQRVNNRIDSLKKERTGRTKQQIKDRIDKNEEAVSDANTWKGDFMPQYENMRSRIQNYFSGWNIMAINTVLNFAKEHNIPTVYVLGAKKLGEDWDSYTSGNFTEDMYKRIYDDTVQTHYNAKKAGQWWKIDVPNVADRIASQWDIMVKTADYEKLYEKYPITSADEQTKNDLLKDAKIKAFVDASMSKEDWNALAIGFWTHIPFYDDVKRAVYLPSWYRQSINDIGKEYVYPTYSSWMPDYSKWPEMSLEPQHFFKDTEEDEFGMWVEDETAMLQAEGVPDDEIADSMAEARAEWEASKKDRPAGKPATTAPETKKYTMGLTETEARMILHELNHYVDHLAHGEQFVTDTSGYYKDDDKENIDMKTYLKSPAEQSSFKAEMRYMLDKGENDDYIVRKMMGEYGGTEKLWKGLLAQVKNAVEV